MTPQRKLLEFHASMTEDELVCPHSDDCYYCRIRRMMAQIAEKMLKRTDIPDDKLILEWGREVGREMKQMPSAN